ncbi:hypothetical protein DPMN_130724 [Dreissena polymorpha]|uniref:Uncharacterized protein n=1 Tax=Dreissena polymorpha TaxID=45954 RepID=A0A9D4K1I1_DREPO|nr:hypothetical protein DPMN_130724 [Dreissena polymorpha]
MQPYATNTHLKALILHEEYHLENGIGNQGEITDKRFSFPQLLLVLVLRTTTLWFSPKLNRKSQWKAMSGPFGALSKFTVNLM